MIHLITPSSYHLMYPPFFFTLSFSILIFFTTANILPLFNDINLYKRENKKVFYTIIIFLYKIILK